jgi:hypothetical protein
MNQKEDFKRGMDAITSQSGGRIAHVFDQLRHLALSRQPADVTLYNGSPHLNVKIDAKFIYAMMYGAGAEKLAELLSAIELSNGATVSLHNIWTINPMPTNGFTDQELIDVDLQEAEKKLGSNGETLRKMISDTYHCSSRQEEDQFLRRFIAS